MSLANIIVQKDAVYMMADAASWNWDGSVCVMGQKLVPLPQIGVCVTMRGTGRLDPAAPVWSRVRSFDELLEFVTDSAKLQIDRNKVERPHADRHLNVEITIAGWIEQFGGFKAMAMSTSEPGTFDYEDSALSWIENRKPWHWYDLGPLYCTPEVDEIQAFGAPLDTFDFAGWNVPAGAAQLVSAQRARLHDLEGFGQISLVGGWVDMATITKTGISLSRVIEWPDEIGQRIVP